MSNKSEKIQQLIETARVKFEAYDAAAKQLRNATCEFTEAVVALFPETFKVGAKPKGYAKILALGLGVYQAVGTHGVMYLTIIMKSSVIQNMAKREGIALSREEEHVLVGVMAESAMSFSDAERRMLANELCQGRLGVH